MKTFHLRKFYRFWFACIYLAGLFMAAWEINSATGPVPLADDNHNPIYWTNSRFLLYYAGAVGLGILVSPVWRWAWRRPGGKWREGELRLHPYELAFLAGAHRRVVETVVTNLIRQGVLRSGPDYYIFSRHNELGSLPHLHNLDRLVLEDIPANGFRSLSDLFQLLWGRLGELQNRLVRLGLILPFWKRMLVFLPPLLLMTGILLAGTARVEAGLRYGFSVGFVFLLIIPAFLFTVLGCLHCPHRTRLGDHFLALVQRQHRVLNSPSHCASEQITPSDLSLAVALFGTVVLSAGPLARFHTDLDETPTAVYLRSDSVD